VPDVDSLIAGIEGGVVQSFLLVIGDRVVAEPAAMRLGTALAKRLECEPDVARRPESLAATLQDLRTYALFAAGKVSIVIESSVLADAGTAASLVDEALEVLPLADVESDLATRERRAAACLLQALRLFQLDPRGAEPMELLQQLPEVAFEGGAGYRRRKRRRRNAAQVEHARNALVALLEAALRADIHGLGESDEEVLAEVLREGLPDGHSLVLAESTWAPGHPIVRALEERGAVVSVGQVSADRKAGWHGLDIVCRELERQTGVGAERDAVAELARRTLRKRQGTSGREESVDAESTARFAAEYRKLANLAGDSSITMSLVTSVVQDRGDENVWAVLDAVGAGRADRAMAGIDRLLRGAEDHIAARLSVFGLLASFCRQLSAVSGMVRAVGVPKVERDYRRFKSQIAPRLQADLPGGRKNPLAGIHPYRLHRAYLAASGLDEEAMEKLPSRILETECRLKGDSAAPDAVLMALVADLTTAIGGGGGRQAT